MFTIWYMGHPPKISWWTSVLVELVLFNLFTVKYVIINFPPVFFKVNSKSFTLAVAIIILSNKKHSEWEFCCFTKFTHYTAHFEYKSWEKRNKNPNTVSVVWIKDHLIQEEGHVLLTSGMYVIRGERLPLKEPTARRDQAHRASKPLCGETFSPFYSWGTKAQRG